MSKLDITVPDGNPDHLFPAFRAKVAAAITRANEYSRDPHTGKPKFANFREWVLFEGFRHPERQLWLYGQGRRKVKYARPGKIVTKSRLTPYHGKGLAADIVFLDSNGHASWDGTDAMWDILSHCMVVEGLESGRRWESFPDSPHCQPVPKDYTAWKDDAAAFLAKKGLL